MASIRYCLTMDCPKCKSAMIVLELQQIEIDYCPSCEGIWLDSGELELMLEDSSEKNRLLASFQTGDTISEKKVRCPICRKNMEKVWVGSENKVLIDKCRRHHGLWFDKDELRSIIKMGNLDTNNRILNLLDDMFKHTLKHSK